MMDTGIPTATLFGETSFSSTDFFPVMQLSPREIHPNTSALVTRCKLISTVSIVLLCGFDFERYTLRNCDVIAYFKGVDDDT